jgi:hypothetical protein
MANIEITARISGTRNGVDWPAIGEALTVPDDEAADLVRMGLVRIVPKPVERATAPKAETRKNA